MARNIVGPAVAHHVPHGPVGERAAGRRRNVAVGRDPACGNPPDHRQDTRGESRTGIRVRAGLASARARRPCHREPFDSGTSASVSTRPSVGAIRIRATDASEGAMSAGDAFCV